MNNVFQNKTKSVLSSSTVRQFHAVLMTYYTRPMMWIHTLLFLLLNYFVLISFDRETALENFNFLLASQAIILNIPFTMIVSQLTGQFSHHSSRLTPNYNTPNFVVAGLILICSLIIMSISIYLHDIPLLMWVSPIFGLLTCYCLFSLLTSGTFEIAAAYVPFLTAFVVLLPISILYMKFPFIKHIYDWYIDGYLFLFPIPVALALITLWVFSERLKDLYIKRAEKGLQKAILVPSDHENNFDDTIPEMNSEQEISFTETISRSFNLTEISDRIILLKAGIVQHHTQLKRCVYINLTTFTLGILVFFELLSPGWNETYFRMSNLFIILMLISILNNWHLQMKRMKTDILKPISKEFILQDLFKIHFYDTIYFFTVFTVQLTLTTFFAFPNAKVHIPSLSSIMISLICFFIFSVYLFLQPFHGIGSGKEPEKVFRRILNISLIIFSFFILFDIFHTLPDWSLMRITLTALFFFSASMSFFYMTYHKWQNIEWGAK